VVDMAPLFLTLGVIGIIYGAAVAVVQRDLKRLVAYSSVAHLGFIVVGIFDVSANLLFGLATVTGALAIVAVLGSLYPAATVLLARIIDHERMTRAQNIGVLAALTGVAMITAGS